MEIFLIRFDISWSHKNFPQGCEKFSHTLPFTLLFGNRRIINLMPWIQLLNRSQKHLFKRSLWLVEKLTYIWGVSRQLPQRAARESQIVLFLTNVHDIKIYLKKLFDKRFRRIFSSAFQWCRQFFRNCPFSPSKSTKRVISQKVYF